MPILFDTNYFQLSSLYQKLLAWNLLISGHTVDEHWRNSPIYRYFLVPFLLLPVDFYGFLDKYVLFFWAGSGV